MSISTTYYLSVSSLIEWNGLPENISEFLDGFFDDIFYKNYISEIGLDGDSGYHKLTLVLFKQIGPNLGGPNGLALLLNPGHTSGITEIPISLEYKWKLLKYIRNIDFESLIENPKDIFEVVLNIVGLDEEEVINECFKTLYSDSLNPILDFVTEFNNNVDFVGTLTLPTEIGIEAAEDIFNQLEGLSNPVDTFEYIFEGLINTVSELDEVFNKISQLFENILGNFNISSLSDLIFPKINVSVDVLQLAMAFPHSILKPLNGPAGTASSEVDLGSDINNPKRSLLTFDIGSLAWDSEKGFIFDESNNINLTPSQIGDTPLRIEVNNATLDLREDSNIPQATEDGRSNAFKGVFIDDATIFLPWPGDSGNPVIKTDNLLVGTEGGITGEITADFSTGSQSLLGFNLFGSIRLEINNFQIEFSKNKIVSSSVTGTINAPSLDNPLQMEIDFTDGFKILVSSDPAVEAIDSTLLTLSLTDLEMGYVNEKLYLAIKGRFKNKLALPLVDKFLPETININNLLWGEGRGLEYNLDLLWKNGLSIGVSSDGPPQFSGFEKVIPINKSKEKNFFKLSALKLNLAPDLTGTGMDALIRFQGAQFNFGKKKTISFTVDGLGIKSHLTQPTSGSTNMGPFNVETSVVPPNGIGVAIDTKAVKGSGYLYLDIDKGEYIGQVQLSVKGKNKTIEINAIGILNTKMPDGGKGFSFMTIISATDLNIDLGGGFELDGLGGMLGIHRTMDTQYLRDNLKTGSIDNVLFPENIQTNLTGIVSDMQTIFPIKRDQFLFGPIAKVTYGKEVQIMDLDVGFAIEFSDPTRLLLIADVGIEIADKIIEIHVAAVGEVNFTKKRIMFDASIYNSKLAGLTLQGDMTFRLFWGKGEKGFLLSVGGFHPDYTPPQHLLVNPMNRLSIIVAKKKNLKIYVEAYFALTSNTLQFGALAHFMAKAGKLRVEAKFGLDTLFQFNPFRFSISLLAYAAIKWGSKSLMSVKFQGKLTGTQPWNVNGKVRFKILFVKITGRVNKTDRKSVV